MKNNTDRKTGKRELILVGGILILALFFFAANRIFFSGPATVVEVTIDGKLVETLDLNKNQEIVIDSVTSGNNRLVIQDGQAWIADATCPDKICIHQGKISRDGEMIVCLPNLMIAKITGE